MGFMQVGAHNKCAPNMGGYKGGNHLRSLHIAMTCTGIFFCKMSKPTFNLASPGRANECMVCSLVSLFVPCVRATGYCRAMAQCALQNYSAQHSARYGSGSWVCNPMS